MEPARLLRRLAAASALVVLASCATVDAPLLRVQRIRGARLGVTGAQLDVVFGVRNPNEFEVLVERFDYELVLNGRRVGRGFVSDPVRLRPFEEERVVSQLDLRLLSMPAAVRRVLENDRVKARAKGHFYLREQGETRKVGFDSEADVDLR